LGLVLAAVLGAGAAAGAQVPDTADTAPATIYDGRQLTEQAKIPRADLNLARRDVLPAARKAAHGQCTNGFSILSTASGAFTRSGANQRLLLYQYCATGHGFGRQGIAVAEGNSIVAHVVYDGGSDYGIRMLPDLDGDGLSELLVKAGGTNQGQTWGVVRVLGWSAGGIKKFGQFAVDEDDCDSPTGAGPLRTTVRLFAVPGQKPSFLAQRFTGSCEPSWNATKWKTTGGKGPVAPGRDRTAYTVLPMPR